MISALALTRRPRYKLHCLSIPLAFCFDDERRRRGCLLRCPQQHNLRFFLEHQLLRKRSQWRSSSSLCLNSSSSLCINYLCLSCLSLDNVQHERASTLITQKHSQKRENQGIFLKLCTNCCCVCSPTVSSSKARASLM